MSLAPITVFAYNRPWHLKQTIESLKRNKLAKQSELFIFSDGPKNHKEQANVEKVRQYSKTIKGFKRVILTREQKNLGLANSIISGVTQIINRYGKIIVLEDDLVLSKGFLKFMNESLMLYKDNKKVGMVSGYIFPLKKYPKAPFFLRGGNCWGWGTWKRSWRLLEENPHTIFSSIKKNNLTNEFDFNGYAGHIEALKELEKGSIKTWAILWYGTQFINGLFGYHPNYSLVQNIGCDGTGIHSGVTTMYLTKTTPSVKVINIPVCENEFVRKELTLFYRKQLASRLSFTQKILSKFKNVIRVYENFTS